MLQQDCSARTDNAAVTLLKCSTLVSAEREVAKPRLRDGCWDVASEFYLCAFKDVYSNRIVGYSIDSRMKSRLAVTALSNAVARRQVEVGDVAGCVIHTDRGSQGEFKRSSQHLDLEVLDGKKAAGCRSCAASEDAFAGQVGLLAAG